jgi:predicted  nucleic acid-binding Zn-ribbon protein
MSDLRLTALQGRAEKSKDKMLQWAADEITRLRNEVSFERTFRISAEKSVVELRNELEKLKAHIHEAMNRIDSDDVIGAYTALFGSEPAQEGEG